LGRGDELDDFVDNETAFIRFLEHQSTNFLSWETDLVLLGDFLDLWQVARDEEKKAEDTKKIELALLANLERDRAQQIVAKHPGTFAALKEFLDAEPGKRRLVIVTGNHDHSLVNPQVRGAIQDAITGGVPGLAGQVVFEHYYDAPELLAYAEHGNQFDKNNDYHQFGDFGAECPGYYFVRLFFNRLERLEPKLDEWGWWNVFRSIWERQLWPLVGTAVRFYRQYRNHPDHFKRIDIPGVPFFGAPGTSIPVTGQPLPEFPDALISDRLDPETIFSTDPVTENRLRSLYHDPGNAEFKEAVDEILRDKSPHDRIRVPEPSPLVEEFGIFRDEYLTAVEGMFALPGEEPQTKPMKGGALSSATYKYVLLGHTHTDKKKQLKNLGVTYYNTGSWTVQRDAADRNVSKLCFVTIQKPGGGSVSAQQDYWAVQ
jgi:UDP-2,3-diacylglucosamine pyrophosphatase LpxH